ncbi:MAG TPA: plastocyanin/azurin family copper-binding protein [Candidatus Dormibacteraeota bacterium]|nr:plastocyanin/azurin family copper-binding protein [Candidatus Dormibacteraeota bacterium]
MSVWKMAVVVAGSALTLAACGGGGSSTTGNNGCNQTGGSTSGTGTQVVKINPDPNTIGRFDPNPVNVKVGDSVEWDWLDSSAPHTVTADDGSFESCTQNSGFKFVVTFSKAGDVKYHCTIHAQMLGDVKVG